MRPARNFAEGRRYVVGIRRVIDGDGEPIEAGDVFRAYRDRLRTDVPEVEARRSHMEGIFRTLHRAGVERDELVLAWDFTVASSRNLSERLLAMRDDAFARLGDDAPAFTVTRVAPSSREGLATEVEGTFEVPNYLTGDGSPGSVLNNGDGPGSSPIPQVNGTFTARFICTIPESATNPDGTANPTRLMIYGHGLLGTAREVFGASSRYAGHQRDHLRRGGRACPRGHPAVLAADRHVAVPHHPDRLQQSMPNTLFLGRLMKHRRASSHPAFQAPDGTPLLPPGTWSSTTSARAGSSAAVSAWPRMVPGLGVPAMNY